jgi:hypothetical protein
MANPDTPDNQQAVENVAEQTFSSEQREDIWALIIAAGIFLLSVMFPAQIHAFFSSVLVLF